jgi:hypothetical protein
MLSEGTRSLRSGGKRTVLFRSVRTCLKLEAANLYLGSHTGWALQTKWAHVKKRT